MRAFTVYWNPYKDETKVNLSAEFKDSDWITRADILSDAIHDLQDLYNKVLAEKM
jgi:hypothetical protein